MSARPDPARSLAAQSRANRRWAMLGTADRAAATQPARDGRMRRYRELVDPGGVMPAEEREARARQLYKADMQLAAFKSVQARAAKAARKGARS